MQHFHLTLACGHSFHESSVEYHNDEPYHPNYVGREMPARCCSASHLVTAQKKVHKLGAPLAHELKLQEQKLERLEVQLQATKAAIEAQEAERAAAATDGAEQPAPTPEFRERYGRLARLQTKFSRYFIKCHQSL